jgi:hypothetical protein
MRWSKVLLGTCWGTHWEQKRTNTSLMLPPKEKKNLGPLNACSLTSLIVKSFYAYLSSLPIFLPWLMAWAQILRQRFFFGNDIQYLNHWQKLMNGGYKLLHLLGWRNPILASGRGGSEGCILPWKWHSIPNYWQKLMNGGLSYCICWNKPSKIWPKHSSTFTSKTCCHHNLELIFD